MICTDCSTNDVTFRRNDGKLTGKCTYNAVLPQPIKTLKPDPHWPILTGFARNRVIKAPSGVTNCELRHCAVVAWSLMSSEQMHAHVLSVSKPSRIRNDTPVFYWIFAIQFHYWPSINRTGLSGLRAALSRKSFEQTLSLNDFTSLQIERKFASVYVWVTSITARSKCQLQKQ